MKYEGPLPEESLPSGHETLTPQELSEIATSMFEREEHYENFGCQEPTAEDMHPDEWAAYCGARAQTKDMEVDRLKSDVIQDRNDLNSK
jgi:hypothetical protein